MVRRCNYGKHGTAWHGPAHRAGSPAGPPLYCGRTQTVRKLTPACSADAQGAADLKLLATHTKL